MSFMSVVRSGLAPAVIPAVAGLLMAGFGSALPAAAAPARAPAVSARPGLHVSGKAVALARASKVGVLAEAPNGSLYFSVGKDVYAVNGTSSPSLVVSAGRTVIALAATTSDVFVQTGLTVFEYSKHSGYVGQWKLSSPVTPVTSAGLYVAGHTVWSWTDWATDTSGFEYATVSEFSTSSSKVRLVNKGDAFPADMAADPAGLYYEAVNPRGVKGFLEFTSPSGGTAHHTTTDVDAPLALASGKVDLLAVGSNGHPDVNSFSASTLKQVGSREVAGTDRNIAGTTAGLVVLAEPCAGLACAGATVSVLNPATGSATGTVTVPDAAELLPGPVPEVITDVRGEAYLVRLAG
jgi:hypothetical protein